MSPPGYAPSVHACRKGNGYFPYIQPRPAETVFRLPHILRHFTAAALAVLLAVCTGNLIQYGQNTALREELHDRQDITDFAAHIAANIPENTYAFGIGVPEIYAILRWDTRCYTLDFADLSLRPEAGDHVMDDIRAKDLPAFLAGEGTMERLAKYSSSEKYLWITENYEVSETFEFKGAVLRISQRKRILIYSKISQLLVNPEELVVFCISF